MKHKLARRALRTCRPRGFSLVESMISVMVLAIGGLATLGTLSFARQQNELEQERVRAYQILMQEAESFRAQLYTNAGITATALNDKPTVFDNGTPNDDTDDTTGILSYTLRRASDGFEYGAYAPPSDSALLELELTLTWRPRGRLGGVRTSDANATSPDGRNHADDGVNDWEIKGKIFRETLRTFIVP